MFPNKIKYQRAVAACGKDATLEEIKAAYVKIGGQLIEEEVSPEKTEEESIVTKLVKKVSKKK